MTRRSTSKVKQQDAAPPAPTVPKIPLAQVLPRKLCDSEGFSRFYDAMDAAGSALLPWFVQNHLVVARRPSA